VVPPQKLVAVVRRPASIAPDWPPIPGLRAATLHVPTAGEPGADPEVAGVWMLMVDDPPAAIDVLGHASALYLVEERPQWHSAGGRGVTRLSFLRAVTGLTRRQFADHWRDIHVPLARVHHPNVVSYVQNVVIEGLTPETPEIDGIAELSFLDVADMHERRYDSPAGQAIIGADVRRFIDLAAGWRLLTVEHVVQMPDSNAF
jgi:uncharacterized protein (TIGR02118 family)